MSQQQAKQKLLVHCHVGSLEKPSQIRFCNAIVHCHVGSLEIIGSTCFFCNVVHCHVGSLEIHES